MIKQMICWAFGHKFARPDGRPAPHVGDATCSRCGIHRQVWAAPPAPPMPACKPTMPEHQVLKVKAGDTVIITADRILNPEQRAFMTQAVSGKFPDGVKVLIVDGGMKVAVVSSQPDRHMPFAHHSGGYQPRETAPSSAPPPRKP